MNLDGLLKKDMVCKSDELKYDSVISRTAETNQHPDGHSTEHSSFKDHNFNHMFKILGFLEKDKGLEDGRQHLRVSPGRN